METINKELLILQNKYIEKYENEINIFPTYWFETEDKDELKIQVLKLALKENKYILDVKNGSVFEEAVLNN